MGGNVPEASLKWPEYSPFFGRVIGHTNIGRGRDKNQDALAAYHDDPNNTIYLSVADGLGCYFRSEQAALEAVTSLPLKSSEGIEISEACHELHEDLLAAHPYEVKNWKKRFKNYLLSKLTKQVAVAKEGSYDRGATTFIMAKVQSNKAVISNIGDSRAYQFRNNKLIYASRDQSLESLVNAPVISDSDPEDRPSLHGMILNCLGSTRKQFKFDLNGQLHDLECGVPLNDHLDLEEEDILILATDGFYSNVTAEEIGYILAHTSWENLEKTFCDMIQRVMRMGWTNMGEKSAADNFTFLIYRHKP